MAVQQTLGFLRHSGFCFLQFVSPRGSTKWRNYSEVPGCGGTTTPPHRRAAQNTQITKTLGVTCGSCLAVRGHNSHHCGYCLASAKLNYCIFIEFDSSVQGPPQEDDSHLFHQPRATAAPQLTRVVRLVTEPWGGPTTPRWPC